MTIENEQSEVFYQGNGATTEFPFSFLIPEGALEVFILEGIMETPVSSSLYSVAGLDNPAGGTVTYPLSGALLPSSQSIIIRRRLPYTQPINIENQQRFFASVFTTALDRATMQVQQIKDITNRAVLTPVNQNRAEFTSSLFQAAAQAAADRVATGEDRTAAETSADLSQAWATGTEPGGAGTKSSREFAEDAQATAETLGALSELEALAERGETAEAGAVAAASTAATNANAQIAPNVAAAVAARDGAEAARDLAETYAGIVSRGTSVADLADPTALTLGDYGYVSGSGDDAIDGLYEVQDDTGNVWVRIGDAGLNAVNQKIDTHIARIDNPHSLNLTQITPPGVVYAQQIDEPIPAGFFFRGAAGNGYRYIGTTPMQMDVVVMVGQSLNVAGYEVVQQFYTGDGEAYMLAAGVNTRRWPYQVGVGVVNSVDTVPSWAETQGIVALDEGDWQSPAAGIANTLLQTSAHRALFFSNARGSLDIRRIWRSGIAATLGGVLFEIADQIRALGFAPRIHFYLAHGEQDGRINTTTADYLEWVQTFFDKCRYYAQIAMLDPSYVAPVYYTLPAQTNSPNNSPAGLDRPIYRAFAQLSGEYPTCFDLGSIYDMGIQKDLVHPTAEAYVLRGERVGRAIRDRLSNVTIDAPLRMTGVELSGTTFTVTLNHAAVRDATRGTALLLDGTDGFEWWDAAAGAFIEITGLTYSGTTITGTLATAPTGTVGQNELRYGLQTTLLNSFEKPEGEKPGGVVRRDHAGWVSLFDPTFTHRSWLCNDFIIPTEAA